MDEYLLLEVVDDVVMILVAYALDVGHVDLLEYFLKTLNTTQKIAVEEDLKEKRSFDVVYK